jgi:protein TonB
MKGQGQRKPEPKNTNIETSLSRCLVEGDTGASTHRLPRRRAFGLSLGIETLLLALLLLAPLFTGIAQPQFNRNLPSMPVIFGAWRSQTPNRNPVTTHDRGNTRFSAYILPMQPARPAMNAPGVAESGDVPIPGNFTDFRGPVQIANLDVPPMLEPPASHNNQREILPLKVSEGVLSAQLISRIEPRYPPLALQTRQEGTVLLHAFISREGRISSLEVVSGSPLFIQAALYAVREWRYRPTTLNGQPVEVETSITVVFRLNR